MAMRLNPYLNFRDSSRAAMEFYRDVFGGELTISTFGEFGMPDSPVADNVMHAMLVTPAGFALMASDAPPEMSISENSTSLSLSGDDADARRGYWDALAEGGQIVMPLERQMWGDDYGMLIDKFGTPWMVNIAGSGADADADAGAGAGAGDPA